MYQPNGQGINCSGSASGQPRRNINPYYVQNKMEKIVKEKSDSKVTSNYDLQTVMF